jgi:hypothetical protein
LRERRTEDAEVGGMLLPHLQAQLVREKIKGLGTVTEVQLLPK